MQISNGKNFNNKKEVYTKPDKIQSFYPEFEVFTWNEKIKIFIFEDGYKIGKYDKEKNYYCCGKKHYFTVRDEESKK